MIREHPPRYHWGRLGPQCLILLDLGCARHPFLSVGLFNVLFKIVQRECIDPRELAGMLTTSRKSSTAGAAVLIPTKSPRGR